MLYDFNRSRRLAFGIWHLFFFSPPCFASNGKKKNKKRRHKKRGVDNTRPTAKRFLMCMGKLPARFRKVESREAIYKTRRTHQRRATAETVRRGKWIWPFNAGGLFDPFVIILTKRSIKLFFFFFTRQIQVPDYKYVPVIN